MNKKLALLLAPLLAVGLLLQPAPAKAETVETITLPSSQGLWTSHVIDFTVTGGQYQLSLEPVPGLPDGKIIVHSKSTGNDVWVHEPTHAIWSYSMRLDLPAGTNTISLLPNVWRNVTISGPGVKVYGAPPTLVLSQPPFVTANESLTVGAQGTNIVRDVPVTFQGPNGEKQQLFRNPDHSVNPVTFSTASLADGIYFTAVAAMGGNGQFTAVTLPILVDRSDAFSDVPKSNWAHKYVEVGRHLGLIAESPTGDFRPGDRITRAEFAKLLADSFGFKSGVETHFFKDTGGHWAEPWINALYENGVAQGAVTGGLRYFNPNQPISRQEAASLVARAYRLAPNQSPLAFTDKQKIDTWAIGPVGALVKQGWMGGYIDGTFRPAGELLRSEAVRILVSPLGL